MSSDTKPSRSHSSSTDAADAVRDWRLCPACGASLVDNGSMVLFADCDAEYFPNGGTYTPLDGDEDEEYDVDPGTVVFEPFEYEDAEFQLACWQCGRTFPERVADLSEWGGFLETGDFVDYCVVDLGLPALPDSRLLLPLLDDPDYRVRGLAAVALGALPDTGASGKLSVLSKSDANEWVSACASESLAKIEAATA